MNKAIYNTIYILSLIIIVFLFFYSVLPLATGVKSNFVKVTSSSMNRYELTQEQWLLTEASCKEKCTQLEYYQDFNITASNLTTFPFSNGIDKGDLVFIVKPKLDELKQGDVIVFYSQSNRKAIHRIIYIHTTQNQTTIITKGDSNKLYTRDDVILINDRNDERIIGKALFKI